MSKYTQKRIEEIQALTTKEIPAAINEGISVDEYLNKYRLTLNLTIIQAIFGAEFITPKKEGKDVKVKFNHKLADVAELSTISHILDDFIGSVENPFICPNVETDDYDDCDEDMDIPACIESFTALPELTKVNTKKINEYLFGGVSISKMMLAGKDIYDLAVVAKKIKKTKVRNAMLLIGGIALVVTGGAVATACIINSKKNDDMVDTDLPDVSLEDAPDVDMEDVPSVELPE